MTSTSQAGVVPGSDRVSERTRISGAELLRLLQYAAPQAWAAPMLLMLGLAASLAETLSITLVMVFLYVAMGDGAQAPMTGAVLDWVFATTKTQLGVGNVDTVDIAGGIFILIAAKACLGFAYTIVSSAVRNRVSEAVRNDLHRHFLEAPYSEIRRYDQGALLNLLATSSWSIADACMSAARVLINVCSVLVFAAFLSSLSWQIAIVAAVGSAALFLAMHLFAGRARRLGAQTKGVNQSLAARTLAALQGMRTIRAFAQEARYQEEFERASNEARANSFALERLHAAIHPATEVGYFALLCVIVTISEASGTAFPTTLTCVALLYRLQPHVRELQGHLLHLAQLEPEMQSVLAMLDHSVRGCLQPGRRRFPGLDQSVRFDNVSFTHPAAACPALTQASFHIPAHAVTAIIGDSAAGKTTIVNLLLRLYRADSGTIYADGFPIDQLLRTDWLTCVAVAGQDVELIEGTVAENIRMARPEACLTEIRAAAAIAGALDFIEALPEGFESWIGQQGLNFSGGQRQRIGMARAVLRDPDMLILDEATNALDEELENQIRTNLRRAFAGRTLLLITHRVKAALSADHVIRMQKGRIVEAGPPELIFGQDGELRRSSRLQATVDD